MLLSPKGARLDPPSGTVALCVCLCVFVRDSASEQARESEREKAREKERKREFVCGIGPWGKTCLACAWMLAKVKS